MQNKDKVLESFSSKGHYDTIKSWRSDPVEFHPNLSDIDYPETHERVIGSPKPAKSFSKAKAKFASMEKKMFNICLFEDLDLMDYAYVIVQSGGFYYPSLVYYTDVNHKMPI